VNNNIALLFKNLYTDLPLETNKNMKKYLNVMDKYSFGLVEDAKKRNSSESYNNTMLDVLVGSNEFKENPLTDKQVKDDVALMFVAGHETSANALAFTFYALAKYQHVQQKLMEEIDSKVGRDLDTPLTRSQVDSVEYLNYLIYEVLRMWPVIGGIIPRMVGKKTDILGDLKVRAGTLINIYPMSTHHNPEFYPDPEVFDPERFSTEGKKGRASLCFMPFGGGPRVCAGNSFAMIEMKMFITSFLQRYHIQLPDPSWEMTIRGTGFIVLPSEDFRIVLTPRK
jgi:cytochrome P450